MPKHFIFPALLCVAVIILTALHLFGVNRDIVINIPNLLTKAGDSTLWLQPGYDDSHWNNQLPVRYQGKWWIRMHLSEKELKTIHPAGIMIELQGAYELFFDGHLVGKNGQPGTSAETESAGNRVSYFLIDSLLSKSNTATHVISLRISSFHDRINRHIPHITIGSYFDLARYGLIFSAFTLLLAGIFLIVMLYYLILYFISFRSVSFLLFSILCFLFFVMLALKHTKYYFFYTYPYQYYRLQGISITSLLISVLLLLFLFSRFRLKNRFYLLPPVILVLITTWMSIEVYDDRSKTLSILGLSFSVIISAYTVYKKYTGSVEIFYGIISCLSCYYYYDVTIYIGFTILVIAMLISLSRKMKEQQKKKEEAIRYSNRLEIELLKKNIQPHFLLNSLATLSEFIETEPKKSLPFVTALADQFDILCEISSVKLITVEKELELCTAYLNVMSYRQDRKFQLHLLNIQPLEMIPPAVFLSIIENGIMHNHFSEALITFTVELKREGIEKKYIIYSPGKSKHENLKDGTGLTYIKARLEENFPGRYALCSVQIPGEGWRTEIVIK